MAVEKEIKIVVDSKQAEKSVENLTKDVEQLDKAADDTTKTTKGVSTAFKGVGTALKAIGIGAIIALFAKLADMLSRNQKVVDFFSTSMEALEIVFNDLFSFIGNNIGTVSNFFKEIFENPLENIKKFGQLVKENIIERFNSALEVAGYLGSALKKLFEGDFKGALDSVKLAGIEMVDVLTGVDDAANKIVDGVNNLVEAGSEYLNQTIEQAKANVELANTAQLAVAQQARLVEQYDRQAEKLRQIRDADLNSVSDRIKANEDLALVLEKQEKAMLAAANAQVAAAQASLNTNNNIENQVALTESLANKEGVLAQIEGFRSEQLANRNALLREQYELNLSIAQGEDERRLAQLEFEQSQATSEEDRLEIEKEKLTLENELLLEDIETKRELYALGTQARVDSENEYLLQKQDIDNQLLANKQAVSDEEVRIAKEVADKEKLYREQVKDFSGKMASQTLDLIGNLAKEGSDLAKGVAVAQAGMKTYESAVAAYAAGSSVGGPAGLVLGPLAAGLAVASGLANIKKILSTKPIEKSAPSGGGSTPSAPAAPSFNLVEGSGTNQIAEGIAGQNQPLKAYVVSSDVTSAQSMDRNIVEDSGF